MKLEEMLAAIRAAVAKKEIKLDAVLGEMGFTKDQMVEQLAGEQLAKYKTGAEFGAKLAKTLGFAEDVKTEDALTTAGEMADVWRALGYDKEKPEKPAAVVGEMVSTYQEQAKASRAKLVEDTIKEKVSGEQAQVLVSRMLKVSDDATKEQIMGEIDSLLKDEALKDILGKAYLDLTVPKGGGKKGRDFTSLRTKKISI